MCHDWLTEWTLTELDGIDSLHVAGGTGDGLVLFSSDLKKIIPLENCK